MQHFSYKGFSASGTSVSGEIDAASIAEARRLLSANGVRLSAIAAAGQGNNTGKPRLSLPYGKRRSPVKLFREIAVLTNAGLTLDQSLKAMRGATTETHTQTLIDGILARLAAGANPSAAFTLVEHLPANILALIASGERTARLPAIFSTVADDLEYQEMQRKKLADAAIYPCFLMLMMMAALAIITFVLVPALVPVFESSGREPPLLLAMLAAFGALLTDPMVAVTGIGFLFIVLLLGRTNGTVARMALNRILLATPVIGNIINRSALARYLQSLALLLENSVAMQEALLLSAACCPAETYRGKLTAIKDDVAAGKRLHEALAASGLFPPSVLSLATVGDEVNRLATTLANAATILRNDAQRTVERLLTLMTPVITIVLGVLVGGLVISVMTALLSINELSG